jgi:hypothetical protein
MSNPGPIQELDTILGRNLLAIERALEVLKPQRLELPECTFQMASDGEAVQVLVTAVDRQGKRTDFGARVRKKTATEMTGPEVTEAVSKLDPAMVLDRLEGNTLLAIRAAEDTFQSRNPQADLADYRIDVVREGDTLVVIYSDKERKPGARGIFRGQKLGFEVSLRAVDLTVLKSHFVK